MKSHCLFSLIALLSVLYTPLYGADTAIAESLSNPDLVAALFAKNYIRHSQELEELIRRAETGGANSLLTIVRPYIEGSKALPQSEDPTVTAAWKYTWECTGQVLWGVLAANTTEEEREACFASLSTAASEDPASDAFSGLAYLGAVP